VRGAGRAGSDRVTAVVISDGLPGSTPGLEAAHGLSDRGLSMTVPHPAGRLMERQLDPEAGKVPARTPSRLGIRARLQAGVAELRTDNGVDGERVVTGVELALPAEERKRRGVGPVGA
jgi:assimilatory nitrate reductase electron transfer subunit